MERKKGARKVMDVQTEERREEGGGSWRGREGRETLKENRNFDTLHWVSLCVVWYLCVILFSHTKTLFQVYMFFVLFWSPWLTNVSCMLCH